MFVLSISQRRRFTWTSTSGVYREWSQKDESTLGQITLLMPEVTNEEWRSLYLSVQQQRTTLGAARHQTWTTKDWTKVSWSEESWFLQWHSVSTTQAAADEMLGGILSQHIADLLVQIEQHFATTAYWLYPISVRPQLTMSQSFNLEHLLDFNWGHSHQISFYKRRLAVWWDGRLTSGDLTNQHKLCYSITSVWTKVSEESFQQITRHNSKWNEGNCETILYFVLASCAGFSRQWLYIVF